jgi:hypothetical protein
MIIGTGIIGTLFDARIDDITYDMVDACLSTLERESMRLEYKQQTPKTGPSARPR